MATIEAVTQTLDIFHEEYPHSPPITEERGELWLSILDDIPDRVLALGLKDYLSTSDDKYIPPVNVFRKHCVKYLHAPFPNPADAWAEIIDLARSSDQSILIECDEAKKIYIDWSKASGAENGLEYTRQMNNYQLHSSHCEECRYEDIDLVYSHPVIERAIKALGGLRTIRLSENEMVDRAHFLKMYGNLCQRETSLQLLPPELSSAIKKLSASMAMLAQLKGVE